MKKFVALFTLLTFFAGQAQAEALIAASQPVGQASANSSSSADSMGSAVTVAIVGLGVIGTVVGIVAASSTNSSSFAH